jgi:hypothetical protein
MKRCRRQTKIDVRNQAISLGAVTYIVAIPGGLGLTNGAALSIALYISIDKM